MSKITIKDLVAEDFCNYKKPSMYIIFPKCDFKCCKECGSDVCQNMSITKLPDKEVDTKSIVDLYMSDDITKAIVIAGLEPFDTYHDLLELVSEFRKQTEDDIVLYTGYYMSEIEDELACLAQYKNIIVKFGRFIPNQQPYYSETLGVNLASQNQFVKKIS